MGFAEEKFSDYLRKNLNLLNNIDLQEMLNELRGVFTVATGEHLDRDLDRMGKRNTRFNFLNDLQKRDDWVNQFLRALWNCEHKELFYTLQAEYRTYRPKRVWEPEPDPPPYSHPPLPELPNPYDPQRCASLPPQYINHGSSGPQPGPPVAPSPSQVQPVQVPGQSLQPYERDLPSPPRPSPPPALAHPDQVDAGAENISKAPIPETSSLPPASFTSEAPEPPVRYSSLPSFPSAKNYIEVTQPLQERARNQEVSGSDGLATSSPPTSSVQEGNKAWTAPQQTDLPAPSQVADSVAQGVPVVNTPRRDADDGRPRTSVHGKVSGSDGPATSSPPTTSVQEGNKAWTAPQQTDLPAPSQVSGSDGPPTSSPPTSSVQEGNTAWTAPQQRDLPAPSQGLQQSSCRPTEVRGSWNVGKPEVLMSSAGFIDATGETNEVQPLSRMPELQISDDESSNGNSRSSGSSPPPASRSSNRGPTPHKVPPTTTPEKSNSWSSPRRSPEENDEPSSSVRGRPPNVCLSAEENSYEMSRDFSYYRLQFNEGPTVDLMAENNVPERRTRNVSGTKDTSDRAASPEKEKSGESNLHNPLVITLSAAIVCLSLYIIWLKSRK